MVAVVSTAMDQTCRDCVSPWLTTYDCAKYLQVCVERVRRLIRENSLPAYKVGREWRIHRHELDRWITENKNGGDR